MSVINRLVRAFETRANIELEGKDKGGIWGEQYAEDVLGSGNHVCYVQNPIIPHPKKRGFFLETDFLVYIRGTLYCIEIKNWRGRVYYPVRTRTILVKEGWFIFKRTVPKEVFSHYDYTKMVQEKRAYRSNEVEAREVPNPLTKTKRYGEDLPYYLRQIEPRLATLPIYSVLGFSEKTDISGVYNFDAGIMHISELPQFLEKYSNPAFPAVPAPWIQQALHRFPTWDRILTTEGEMINGTLLDQALQFKDTRGKKHALPYRQLQYVELRRDGTFSAYDEMRVTYVDGQQQTFQSVGGEVRLNRFQGEVQVHKLRNVSKLKVGIANKFA